MKTLRFFFFFLLLGSATYSQPATPATSEYRDPLVVGFWLYPFMNQTQADQMCGYDILIMHNELFYKQSQMIDYILRKNQKIKLLVYFNPVEWFVPPYEDSPWAIKMVRQLNEGDRKNWWLLQPNGKPVTFWTGTDGRKTNLMDMRLSSQLIDGENYPEYIARQFITDILSDKRIAGMECDNTWANAYWLGKHDGNKGVDFDRDKIADKNGAEIDRDWQAGENRFIKLIREHKGNDFIMVANPGNLSYNIDFDGKILENWPFEYAGDTTNGGWNISMFNATKTGPYTILNARPGNWFFTFCSAKLLGVCFSDVQNAPYRAEYRIDLGKPLEPQPSNFKKNLPIYSRKFEKGTVYVCPRTGKAWIEDINANPLFNEMGQCIK